MDLLMMPLGLKAAKANSVDSFGMKRDTDLSKLQDVKKRTNYDCKFT